MNTGLILSPGIGGTRSNYYSYYSKYTPVAVPSRDREATALIPAIATGLIFAGVGDTKEEHQRPSASKPPESTDVFCIFDNIL